LVLFISLVIFESFQRLFERSFISALVCREERNEVGVVFHQEQLYYFYPETGHMCGNALGHNAQGVYLPQRPGLFRYRDNAYWALDATGRIGVGLIDCNDGARRYADEQGRLVSGLVTLNGRQYYFYDESAGYHMALNQFIQMAWMEPGNDGILYAGPDGAMVTGWQEIQGKLHCFDENGLMLYDTIKDGRYINMYGEVQ